MSRRYLLIAATRAVAPEIRVLAEQLAAVDPQAPRTIVVVDEDPETLELVADQGEVVTGAQLGIELDEVGRWAGAYGPFGVMWASFPHVLRAVGKPGEHVLWLGAELHVAAVPSQLWDALESSDVVAGRAAPPLGPHLHTRADRRNGQPYALQPVTAVLDHDGELVSRSVLGWHVGSDDFDHLLEQWPVPRDVPTHEPLARGTIAQQWFNALPLSSSVATIDSAGLVLSVAQLLAREVSSDGELILADNEPLSLLGLRNFDAEQPHLLEGEVRTARVSERPTLAPLLRERSARLLTLGWQYRGKFEEPDTRWRLDEGMGLDERVQDVIRSGLRSGELSRSPFTSDGFSDFHAYATAPGRHGASVGVNRLLAGIHANRPDLQAAYPALDGPDGPGFLGWAWVYGRVERSIPESFLPPRPAFLDADPGVQPGTPAKTAPDTPGVNLAGYFTSELGLGESARQLATAMKSAGVPTTAVQGLLVPPTRQQADFQPLGPKDAHHDVNVIVVNGDGMPDFARDVGPGFFEGRSTIAVWWWEVEPFPIDEWSPALEWIDEIWVGTDFIKSLIEPHVDIPVWVFPVPVSVKHADPPVPREHFGFSDDETVFLYVWDYHSTEARKNPSGLVEAYKKAFPDPARSGTRLVLKCINHENLPGADEKVRLAAAGRPDIQFIDWFLSGHEKDALLELCDCYVSPHRSEGFGYTPAEAMLLGKPVVVTGYGGTTQYTDESVARMVKWKPAKVGRGAHPYPPDGDWADPDLDDLADALSWVVDEPAAAAEMARRGRERIASNHTPARSGAEIRDRLKTVRSRADANTALLASQQRNRRSDAVLKLRAAARKLRVVASRR